MHRHTEEIFLLDEEFDPYSIAEGRALPIKLTEMEESQLNELLDKVLAIAQNR